LLSVIENWVRFYFNREVLWSYAQVCGTSSAWDNMDMLKFRRRYARLLRDEVARTVLDPAEAKEELRHLMQVFAH
jgi:hypothetical protein